MLRVGLTGGIGAGKSVVARRLAELGAVVIDADVVAREVVAPGTAGYAAVVAEFGPSVVRADTTLDRARLAKLNFLRRCGTPTPQRDRASVGAHTDRAAHGVSKSVHCGQRRATVGRE